MKAIKIEWRGETLVIGESETFELGEQLEEITSLAELAAMGEKPKFHKLARCYAEMINFAGGQATPKEIHTEMMDQIKSGSDEGVLMIATAIASLIAILMDGAPDDLDEPDVSGADGKKKKAS